MGSSSLIFIIVDLIGLFLLISSWKMAGGARAIYAVLLLCLSLFLFYETIVQVSFLSNLKNLSDEPNLFVSLVDNLVSNLIWTIFILALALVAIAIGLLTKGKLVKIAAIFAILIFVFLGLILPSSLLPFSIFGMFGLLFIYRKTFEHNFFEGMKILLSKKA